MAGIQEIGSIMRRGMAIVGVALLLLFPIRTGAAGISETDIIAQKIAQVTHTAAWENRETAEIISEVLEKFPEIDRDRFLTVAYQESSFNKSLVKHGDYGLFQIHLSFWRDKYKLDERNVMDLRVNTYVAADIWSRYAGQKYHKYNGCPKNSRNDRLYKKKLRIIKSI